MDEDDIRALTEIGNPDFYTPPWEKDKDYSKMTRSNSYPFNEDIDYNPRIDEDWSEHDG